MISSGTNVDINIYINGILKSQECSPSGKFDVELEKNDAKIGIRLGPEESKHVSLCLTANVLGTIEEFMDAMRTENTSSFLRWASSLHKNFLDGSILNVFAINSKSNDMNHSYDFLGICWASWRVDTKLFQYKKYDTCFMKRSGMTYDRNGNTIGYVIIEPVTNCRTFHDFDRCNNTFFCIFRTSNEWNRTSITCLGRISTVHYNGGSFSLQVAQRIGNTALECWNGFIVYLETQRVSKMVLVDVSKWIPDSERSSCSICYKKFFFVWSKHHCRACGDIVCKKCLLLRCVLPSEFTSCAKGDNVYVVKFCLKCVVDTRRSSSDSLFHDELGETNRVATSVLVRYEKKCENQITRNNLYRRYSLQTMRTTNHSVKRVKPKQSKLLQDELTPNVSLTDAIQDNIKHQFQLLNAIKILHGRQSMQH